jgi:DMSO/TMAO reductase YedYZ molybdopterin-dependent catalytic subunit
MIGETSTGRVTLQTHSNVAQRSLFGAVLAIVLLAAPCSAQEMVLTVDGQVEATLRLSLDDLRSMPRARVEIEQQGARALYEGVPLVEVLRRAGVSIGRAPLQGRTLLSVLFAAGADGFRALFALAELDPASSDRRVILADTRDGQPLSAKEGPLRLIAPGDKYPARWIRNLVRLTVSDRTAN